MATKKPQNKAKAKSYKDVFAFQKAHPTKASREKALKGMSDSQIDKLVLTCGTAQGKSYYASFKHDGPCKNGVSFIQMEFMKRI